tara:strand:+ start:1364 stop:3823 length:2460 start_codon:yes stop_codon:yes gene_type:complete
MAYRSLYKPLTQFVDPMSTEIAEQLRQRFLTNYENASLVEQEMMNLQAAPFATDMQYRDELVNSTNQTLTGISKRGDYENMTVPVMNAARKYNMESAPIKQNYELYSAYQTGLKEAYEEGKIDYEDYEGTLALSQYGYTGLQRDAQGNYSNPFVGVTMVQDPEIEKRINEALKGIVAEEHNVTRQDVGVVGPDGVYTVKTEKGYKTVSAERVQEVMNMVMSDGQVREYMARKAEIRYGMADPEQVEATKLQYMNQFESEAARYDEMAEDSNLSEEQREVAAAYASQVRQTAGQLATADVDRSRQMIQALEMQRIENGYRDAAESRFAYFSPTKDSRIVTWDQKYLKTIEASGGVGQNVAISAPGEVAEYISPSGVSLYTKRSSMKEVERRKAQMSEAGYYDEILPGLTFDQLRTMTAQDFINAKGGAEPDEVALFNRAKAAQQELLAEEHALNVLLEEAGNATGETPEARVQSAMESHDRIPEIIRGIKQQYNVDNATALAYLHSYLNEYEASMFADPGVDPREYGRLAAWWGGYNYDLLQDSSHPEGFGQFFNETFGVTGGGGVGRSADLIEMLFSPKTGISNSIQDALEKSDEQLNEYIEGMSTRQYTPTVSTNLLGMTKGEMDQLNDLFAKTNPHARGEAFVSQRTGRLVGFDEIMEEQGLTVGERGSERIVSVGEVRFNPASPGPAGPTLELTYEVGKDRIPVVAHIPMSQITGAPGINNWYASMGASFYRQALVQRQHGVAAPILTAILPPNANPALPEGGRISFEVNIEDDKVTVLTGPGANRTMSLTSALDRNGFINKTLVEQGFTTIVPGR